MTFWEPFLLAGLYLFLLIGLPGVIWLLWLYLRLWLHGRKGDTAMLYKCDCGNVFTTLAEIPAAEFFGVYTDYTDIGKFIAVCPACKQDSYAEGTECAMPGCEEWAEDGEFCEIHSKAVWHELDNLFFRYKTDAAKEAFITELYRYCEVRS